MIIESIKTYIHSLPDKVVSRQYTTILDNNNKRILEIVEHSFVPYNIQGKQQTEELKGINFDQKV